MLFEADAEEICRHVVNQAKEGNMQAAKIILDRLLSPKKDRPIHFKLPMIYNATDAVTASRLICHAVGNGELTPLEGESLSKMVETHAKNIELFDFGLRLEGKREINPSCTTIKAGLKSESLASYQVKVHAVFGYYETLICA